MPTCPVFAGPVTYLECDIRLFRNSAIPLFHGIQAPCSKYSKQYTFVNKPYMNTNCE